MVDNLTTLSTAEVMKMDRNGFSTEVFEIRLS
jgi:hypothetical protein